VRFGPNPAVGLGRSVSATAPGTRIYIDIVLRPNGRSGQSATARNAFGRALAKEATPVLTWVRSHHLSATRIGIAVHFSASARAAAALFETSFADYRYHNALVYASGAPALPAAFAGRVEAVLGLSDLPIMAPQAGAVPGTFTPSPNTAAPAARPAGSSIPSACSAAANEASSYGGHTMVDTGTRYGIYNLLSAGDMGQGKTVALIEFAPVNHTDIASYDSCFGISSTVTSIPEDGGASSADSPL
jgi:subtilase family serine protease